MDEICVHVFEFPGGEKSQWMLRDGPNGTVNLIFQFYGERKKGFDQYLFDAADTVWEKTDVGYTDEFGAYDIVMTAINPGTEMSLVRMLLKKMNLSYKEIVPEEKK